MMNMKKSVSVFFDTNILESRNKNSLKSFSEINIPKSPFYDVIQLINEYELWDSVEILIPDMVVMELKYHLNNEYKNIIDQMKNEIQQYKERLGCLA